MTSLGADDQDVGMCLLLPFMAKVTLTLLLWVTLCLSVFQFGMLVAKSGVSN